MASPVARLATVRADGQPRLVPLVFAVDGDDLHSAVDRKPKSTTSLGRLADIAAHPAVSLLVDHYADDWTQLWWARADGLAEVNDLTPQVLDLLVARYPVYKLQPPPGPVVTVHVERWSGWAAGRADAG